MVLLVCLGHRMNIILLAVHTLPLTRSLAYPVLSRNVFAVLEEPPPPTSTTGKLKKWGGRKEDPKVAAAEAAVLAAAMAGSTVVRIRALDGLGVSVVCQQVGAGASD